MIRKHHLRGMGLLAVLVAAFCMAGTQETTANSAVWTGLAGNGLWADNGNWTAPYPNGTDEVAQFSNGNWTVNVDANVTVGDIRFGWAGAGNTTGALTLNDGGGSLTFRHSTGTSTVYSYQSGSFYNGSWSGSITAMCDLVIAVGTLDLGKCMGSIGGDIASAAGQVVTINANSRKTPTWNGNNALLSGTINVYDESGYHIFSGANSAGGSHTTVRVIGGRCDLMGVTNKIALFEVVGSSCQTVHNNALLGSVTVNSGKIWHVFTTTDKTTLRIAPNETVFIDTGALLHVDGFNSLRSGYFRISTNSTLAGSGTIATLPSAGHAPEVILEPGATLNPGSTNVPAGIFHVGSSSYPETKVTVQSGAAMAFDLVGLAAGTEYDQVRVEGGTLTMTNAILNIASLASAYSPFDKLFLVVENGGTIAGTFSNLADGATADLGSLNDHDAYTATINYTGNAGNGTVTGGHDIVLSNFQSKLLHGKGALILIR